MDEAETANPNEYQIEKTIEALLNNTKIIFQIKLKDNSLTISTEIKDSLIPRIYQGIFSQKDIQENKYFLNYDTKEILEELISKSQYIPPTVLLENNALILKIGLGSVKFKEIEFILKPKSKNTEDKFKELYDIAKELKKENVDLKKEINNLKAQLSKLTKELIDFKNKIEEKEKEKYLYMDSNILRGEQEKMNSIKEFISPNKKVSSELKYRMTRDGVGFDVFHRLCDNISPNLLLIKDNNGDIFGGFTKACWDRSGSQKNDTESFLFSLSKKRKYYQKHQDYKTIFCYSDKGPWFFGGDIGFYQNDMSECQSSGTGDYLNESLSSNIAGNYFKVQEVEFYKIIIE